ncbi:MAG: hypothetical protein ABEK50_00135 [bacterium]
MITMRIGIIGAGAAGLSAAYALRDIDASVYVFDQSGDQPDREWFSTVDLEYLSRQGLFGNSVFEDIPLERRITEHEYLVTDGKTTRSLASTTVPPERSTRYSVKRNHIDRWLLEQIDSTQASILWNADVRSLVRSKDQVVGLHTSKGFFRTDLVLLAEGDTARFLQNENYDRSLPSEQSGFFSITQQTFNAQSNLIESRFRLNSSDEGLTRTFLLPSPSGEPPINLLARVQTLRDSLSLDIMTPLDHQKELSLNPRSLLEAVREYPLFKELYDGFDPESVHSGLLNTPTERGVSNLVDHGLAIGGATTGAGSVIPRVEKFSTAVQMGYQFARMAEQLNQRDSSCNRETLRKYYSLPLSKNPNFSGERSSITDLILKDRTVFQGIMDLVLGDTSLYSARFWRYFLNCLREDFSLSDASLPDLVSVITSLPAKSRDLIPSEVSDITTPLSNVFASVSSLSVRKELNDLFENYFHEAEDISDGYRRLLGYFLRTCANLSGGATLAGGLPDPSGRSPGIRSDQSMGEMEPSFGVTLSLDGSLSASDDGTVLKALCPTGVFDVSGDGHVAIHDENCIYCNYCHWGKSGTSVRPRPSRSSLTDTPPLLSSPETLPVLSTGNGVQPESVVLAVTVLVRLRTELNSVEHYLSPERAEWLESLASLARRFVDDCMDCEEEGQWDENLIEQSRSLINRVQQRLAEGNIGFASNLCEQILGLHLNGVPNFIDTPDRIPQPYRVFHRELTSKASPSDNNSASDHSPKRTDISADTQQDYGSVLRSLHNWIQDVYVNEFNNSDRDKPLETGRTTATGWESKNQLIVFSETPQPENVLAINRESDITQYDSLDSPEPQLELENNLRILTVDKSSLNSTTDDPLRTSVTTSSDFADTCLKFYGQLAGVLGSRQSSEDLSERPVKSELQQARDLYYEPRILTARKGIQALRDFPDSIVDSTELLNRIKETAGRVLLVGMQENPIHARNVTHDHADGIICFDETIFLRLCPFDYVEELKKFGQTGPRDPVANHLLSLSDQEETIWSDADQDGVMDHLIRQWRRTAGDCRQLLNEEGQSELFKGAHAVRLFVARCLITRAQVEIRSGRHARTTALAADLWMRQCYEWKQDFQNVTSGPTETSVNMNRSQLDEEVSSQNGHDFSLQFNSRESTNKSLRGLRNRMTNTVKKSQSSETIQATKALSGIALDIETLRRSLNQENRHETSELQLIGVQVYHLLTLWSATLENQDLVALLPDRKGSYRFWKERVAEASSRWFETMYESEFQAAVRTLRRRALRHWWEDITFDDDDLNDRVDRAFDRTSGGNLQFLIKRPNLAPWYRSFTLMLAELRTLQFRKRIEGTDPMDSHYRNWANARSRRCIRKTASLVSHGLREAENQQDAPEAQLWDEISPETAYFRRNSQLSED